MVALKWAAIEDAAGSEDRVQKIANDIMKHLKTVLKPYTGKAMVVYGVAVIASRCMMR
jgi:type I restriction enzyme R subunit